MVRPESGGRDRSRRGASVTEMPNAECRMPKGSALVNRRQLLDVQTPSAFGIRHLALTLLPVIAAALAACALDPEQERLKQTTRATYDAKTGRLQRLTYDANK